MRLRLVIAGLAAGLSLIAAGDASAQLPAMRDRPLSAAERVRYQALEANFVRISSQRQTSVAAVRAIARKLGTRLTTDSPEAILRAIDERAGELSTAQKRIQELETDLGALDSMRLAQAVQPLLAEARAAIADGDLETAETRLQAAASRFSEAREGMQGRLNDLSVREAAIVAETAEVRRASFDFEGALALYKRAADLVSSADPQAGLGYILMQARNLQDLKRPAEALQLVRSQAYPLVSREVQPLEWAKVRAREASALFDLASTEADFERLAEMYAEVVAVVPKATDPIAWVTYQYDGIAVAMGLRILRQQPGVDEQIITLLEELSDVVPPTMDARVWSHGRSMLLANLVRRAGTMADNERALPIARDAVARSGEAPAWEQAKLRALLSKALYYIAAETRDAVLMEESAALSAQYAESVPAPFALRAWDANFSALLSYSTLADWQGSQGADATRKAITFGEKAWALLPNLPDAERTAPFSRAAVISGIMLLDGYKRLGDLSGDDQAYRDCIRFAREVQAVPGISDEAHYPETFVRIAACQEQIALRGPETERRAGLLEARAALEAARAHGELSPKEQTYAGEIAARLDAALAGESSPDPGA
ncbi:MAG: hypothetical protein EON87_08975 [Brevundimonas sp.]|nr:MAG: hypothetical protein EON87_08975 [Brevundimonas sp.]